jgi:hypothetical protein
MTKKRKNKKKTLHCPPQIERVPNAIRHGIVTGYDYMRNQPNIYNSSSPLDSNENFNLNEDDPSDINDTNQNQNYSIVQGSSIAAIKMIKFIKN